MSSKITVVLSVYRPNTQWLLDQIHSIENQKNLSDIDILCWNDSPQEFDAEIWFHEQDFSLPIRVLSDGTSRGITGAFEKLTQEADGEYIAYCDQDDIWLPDKLQCMMDFLESHRAVSCCHCDAILVDEKMHPFGRQLYPDSADHLNVINRQKQFLLRNNWTLGCAMLIRASVAKNAVPFPKMVYHDQWLAIWAAFEGGVYFLPDALIQHRQHSEHASQMLAGIDTSAQYYQKKLAKDRAFLACVCERIPGARAFYAEDVRWMEARVAWHEKKSLAHALALWKHRHVRKSITLFELALPFFPDALLPGLLSFLRKKKG